MKLTTDLRVLLVKHERDSHIASAEASLKARSLYVREATSASLVGCLV